MQPESSERFGGPFAGVAELPYTPADLRSAEAVDAALAAVTVGVDTAAIRRAWGEEAGALAELAERLVPASARSIPAPSPAFVGALERRVADAFDARPARRRRAWSLPRFGRLTEMALVGAAAVALAASAFLLSPGRGIAPNGTPTAEAATEAATKTATLATPEVQVTRPPDGASELAMRRNSVRHRGMNIVHGAGRHSQESKAASLPPRFTDGLSSPHAQISQADDTAGMNTTAASHAHDQAAQDRPTLFPAALGLSGRSRAARAGRLDAPAWAYAAAADWSLAWSDPAIRWDAAPAPLPSPATIAAGKRRLMALAERLRDERREPSEGLPSPLLAG